MTSDTIACDIQRLPIALTRVTPSRRSIRARLTLANFLHHKLRGKGKAGQQQTARRRSDSASSTESGCSVSLHCIVYCENTANFSIISRCVQ